MEGLGDSVGRYPLLDGLRAAAALLVLVSHVGFWTGAAATDFSGGLIARGDSGVAIFFAISSFLLLRPWIRAGAGDRPAPVLGGYAIVRIARILPAYLLALAAVLAVAAAFPAQAGGLGGLGKVLSHLVLAQGYADHMYQGFSQSWSLTTELTFYVMVPFLGLALGRRLNQGLRPALGTVGVVAASGIVVQGMCAALLLDGTSWAGVLALSAVGHAAWFAVGAAVCLLSLPARHTRHDLGSDLPRWLTSTTRAASERPLTFLGLALLVYLFASSPLLGPRDLSGLTAGQAALKEFCYALLAGLLLLAAVRPAPGTRPLPELSDPAVDNSLRTAGDLTYGIFLWHVLALQVVFLVADKDMFTHGFWLTLLAVVSLSTVLARLSVTCVERPILRWAHRLRRADEQAAQVPAPRTAAR